MELREYQTRAVEETIQHQDAGRRVCLVAPTGAGKTVMMKELIRRTLLKGRRALVTAHTRDLVEQTALRVGGPQEVGLIMAGHRASPYAKVQVASIDTLVSRGLSPDVEDILVDECHHSPSDTYREFLAQYPSVRLVGLTATPERIDGRPLGDLADSLVIAASYSQLLADGFLVPCRVFRPSTNLSGSGLAQEPLKAYRTYGNNEQGFGFASTVEQAKKFCDEFNAGGIKSAVIEADTPPTEREHLLRLFKLGALRVLWNVYVLTEGIDVPQASVAILARGCTHVSPFLQMVGRVLRPSRGKKHATLIDLSGASHKHGHPTEDRLYSLEGRGIRRVSESVTICINCGFPKDGFRCPGCGFSGLSRPERLPQFYGLNLEEFIPEKPAPWGAKTSESFQQKKLAEFRKKANEKGYKPGWVKYQFSAAFGRMPTSEELSKCQLMIK